MWPNEDGRGWRYALVREEWPDSSSAGFFDSLDSVPPAPPLSVLRGLVAGLVDDPSVNVDSASLELRFSGQITTQSGVVAQNLVETVSAPVSATLLGSDRVDPFLAQLVIARPDLKRKLERRLGARMHGSAMGGLLFLHGYAWRKTASAIIGFGDVDTLPSWKYLESNIVPGAEFTQQLVPSLADNVFLHARIVGKRSVVTPYGTYANAIEVDYSVDYGVGHATDKTGSSVGFLRSVSFGTVAYVDSLGPIACTGRHLMRVESASKVTNGVGDERAVLTEALFPIPRPGFALGGRWRR